MAQLVARDFWEVEVAGSSPVTQTINVIFLTKCQGYFLIMICGFVLHLGSEYSKIEGVKGDKSGRKYG